MRKNRSKYVQKHKRRRNKQYSKKVAFEVVDKLKELDINDINKEQTLDNECNLDIITFKEKEENKKSYYIKMVLFYLVFSLLLGLVFYFIYSLICVKISMPIVNTVNVATDIVENKPKVSNLTVDINNDVQKIYNWDNNSKQLIKDYLSNYTYIEIEQTNVTTQKNTNTQGNRLITNLNCDFKNERLQGNSLFKDTLGDIYTGFFYDKTSNLYLNKDKEDKEWEHSAASTVTVNFSLDDYSSVVEFYNFLLGNFPIRDKAKGNLSEDYLYFEDTRQATSKDISNVDYDKLGYQKNTLYFKVEENGLKPISMIKEVTFDKDDITYSSKLVIIIKDLSNKQIVLPDYNENVDSLSENKTYEQNSLVLEDEKIEENKEKEE